MRGTCFYILGLLAKTSIGRYTLDHLGWDFPLNPNLAIAVPKDVKQFLSISNVDFVGAWAINSNSNVGILKVPSTTSKNSPKITEDNLASIILGYISNLGNNV